MNFLLKEKSLTMSDVTLTLSWAIRSATPSPLINSDDLYVLFCFWYWSCPHISVVLVFSCYYDQVFRSFFYIDLYCPITFQVNTIKFKNCEARELTPYQDHYQTPFPKCFQATAFPACWRFCSLEPRIYGAMVPGSTFWCLGPHLPSWSFS